jgi:hypothetical protein
LAICQRTEGPDTFPKLLHFIIYAAGIVIISSVISFGQSPVNVGIPDSNTAQIITLKDGSEIMGRATNVTDSEVSFRTELGELKIPISKIKGIREVPRSSIKGGEFWPVNPNATRLFFSPTARMLKEGQGYFSDYYVFFPGISFGLSDNITIGGGVSLFPGLGLNKQIFYFTPKIGLATSKNSCVALGALIISIPYKIDEVKVPTFGILYGVGTYGGPDGSISGGLGFGFANDRVANKPVGMIGGEKRLSRRISFVSENWILPEVKNPIISYGARFFGENISVDLGFITPTGSDFIFPGIPWVDFVFNFR